MKTPVSKSLWFVGAGLGVAFLVAMSLRVIAESAFLIQGDRVLASVRFATAPGSKFAWQLLRYGTSLLLVHVLFGLVAAAMARLTLAAHPSIRTRPSLLVTFWFALLALWVLGANTIRYPATIFSHISFIPRQEVAGIQPVDAAAVAFAAVAALLLAVTLWQKRPPMATLSAAPRGAWMATLALIMAGSLAAFAHRTDGPGTVIQAASNLPNVVIIGIDSLRTDLVLQAESGSATPAIRNFLSGAHVFADTISPLARTYPAWVSVLTGQHPVTTRARFNLVPRDSVLAGSTLGWDLGALGYRSLYATDEVRFANIDASFGFDNTVTPPIGAGDFILGTVNDLPLPNVLSNTPVGRWLFPHTYANRAAHVTYEPATFSREVARALPRSGPVFLVTHLTLAHVPYSWAGRAKPETVEQYGPAYEAAIEEVDRQFASILEALEHRGILDNAIVVLLSDHGETMGHETDSLFGSGAASAGTSLWGHGTSVMSPHQYQVLLAVRGFGPYTDIARPGRHEVPASLEDIRPTLLDLLGQDLPGNVDGLSLGGVLRGEPASIGLQDRVRYTETGFNTPSVLQGKYDAGGALQEGAAYYDVNPDTGWVQLKPDKLAELMRTKERAAIHRGVQLAAIPGPGGRALYYLANLSDSTPPVRLEARPDSHTNPDGARLWDALHTRFESEFH